MKILKFNFLDDTSRILGLDHISIKHADQEKIFVQPINDEGFEFRMDIETFTDKVFSAENYGEDSFIELDEADEPNLNDIAQKAIDDKDI